MNKKKGRSQDNNEGKDNDKRMVKDKEQWLKRRGRELLGDRLAMGRESNRDYARSEYHAIDSIRSNPLYSSWKTSSDYNLHKKIILLCMHV